MKWISEPLNYAESNEYVLVDFALVKETPKAIRIKLDRSINRIFATTHDRFYKNIRINGICVWIPKSLVRNYTGKRAFIYKKLLRHNVTKESKTHIKRKYGLSDDEILDIKLPQ
jgi:hypothetical protein